ncbi:hypothetical protein [Winogradskyella sp. SM1960]|uniref:hypothetical protein n=1 Tax=Winogradskyella sp. SM1960 TaxID=2865955 RepID=UPI001CD749C0|nr:hypothetical protein [Winogradskyella sp. SM1960]
MRHLKVLVVTRDTTIPKVLNWKVSTVNAVEIAIEKLQQQAYNVVAISNTFNIEDKSKLSQVISILYDDATLVEYTDNKTISETVKTSYWRKNKPNTQSNYLDNSFEIKLANSIN